MFGQNKFICVAGKNQCSIDFIEFIKLKIPKNNILVLPNISDKGHDSWQPSLRKYAKKNCFKIISLKKVYKIQNLIFLSIEYESIINVDKFYSAELFNFHFSLLPKYRGCHTNFYQIYNGEKYSGVTLHKIDSGIDTGPIIDKIKFPIKKNTDAYKNYFNLMKNSVKLLKKNFKNIINKNYIERKQNLKKGSYYSRNSINYLKMKIFKTDKINLKLFNQMKAFIFPPFQFPILNNNVVHKIKYNKNKIKIYYG